MQTLAIKCREVSRPTPTELRRVRRLYESSLDPSERIPFEWIEHPLLRPKKQIARKAHLIVARSDEVNSLLGFVNGMSLHGFGGYASYVAVAPRARGYGLGTRLYKSIFRAMKREAARNGESLPFVLWDSHPPRARDSWKEWDNWRARLMMFSKVGAYRIGGVDFASPNCADHDGPPVKLHVFLKPIDDDASSFDGPRLRGIVSGLLRRVYRISQYHYLYVRAVESDWEPRLEVIE